MSDVGDVEFWKRQTAGLVFCWRSIKKQPKKHNSSTLLCIQIVVFDNVTFQFSGFYLIPISSVSIARLGLKLLVSEAFCICPSLHGKLTKHD